VNAGKNYQNFEGLTVRLIGKDETKKMMIENHYAKKWQTYFGAVNVGIFDKGDLLGAASFGSAMNPSSWTGLTSSAPEKCLELNRLWVDDQLTGNSETWLLGQAWKMLRAQGFELVQSFADGRLGVGTIYQAANFTYHGFHETLFHRGRDGVVWHDVSFSNTAKYTTMLERNVMHARGLFSESFTVRTYRYLYPLSRNARKSVIPAAEPYPKDRAGETVRVGYVAPALQVARAIHIADALLLDGEAADLFGYLNRTTDGRADKYLALTADNQWIESLKARYDDALF
jgi:hypothetical protein